MVHCRTGSLEIIVHVLLSCVHVHCRTGSLETLKAWDDLSSSVHCRTGSLEILDNGLCVIAEVHCRTGSLEKHYGLSAKQAATVFQSAAKYERIYQRRMENAKNTIDSDG